MRSAHVLRAPDTHNHAIAACPCLPVACLAPCERVRACGQRRGEFHPSSTWPDPPTGDTCLQGDLAQLQQHQAAQTPQHPRRPSAAWSRASWGAGEVDRCGGARQSAACSSRSTLLHGDGGSGRGGWTGRQGRRRSMAARVCCTNRLTMTGERTTGRSEISSALASQRLRLRQLVPARTLARQVRGNQLPSSLLSPALDWHRECSGTCFQSV